MIDIENNTIDGKHYWRLTPVYSVSNDGNKVINNNYIRVTARDHETLYAFEENIFDAKNNKFLFKHWYDYISECLREQKKLNSMKKKKLNKDLIKEQKEKVKELWSKLNDK